MYAQYVLMSHIHYIGGELLELAVVSARLHAQRPVELHYRVVALARQLAELLVLACLLAVDAFLLVFVSGVHWQRVGAYFHQLAGLPYTFLAKPLFGSNEVLELVD